jgi:hypothetical protein
MKDEDREYGINNEPGGINAECSDFRVVARDIKRNLL